MSTYTPIASQTLSASASSVTFSGIPQNYTDLVMAVVPAQASAGQGDIYIQFNSDGGSNYSATALYGSGSAAGSTKQSNQTGIRPEYYGYPDTVVGKTVQVYHIMNYSNSTTYKTLLSRANSAAQGTDAVVGLWRSTAAITSITLTMNAGASFISGSTLNLYGIDASLSAQAKATGGNSIYTDGTYWYHIFRSSGVFTPTTNISNVDYLVVAGGGGAGGGSGSGGSQLGSGGGGAGGLRSTVSATGGGGSLESKLSLTNGTPYVVTIGAGGAGMGYGPSYGIPGSNSSVSGTGLTTITSTGGGGGSGGAGGTGGSGAGGTNSASGGSGTANQGYAGGSGSSTAGGGGGGAGAAGANASGSNAGAGGVGVAVAITGSSVYYAGGGGGAAGANSGGSGGAGGNGGGGTGPNSAGSGSVEPTPNTGGGGYGGNGALGPWTGGASGIVIFRYAV